MDKKKYEYRDSSGVEHSIEIDKTNFALAQTDKSIHDQKLKTKPTTFFKDAVKRFSKNKSSVAGAIILGTLLILSVVVPFTANPGVDLSDDKLVLQKFLEPKLFNAGTGFWDGTKRLTNIPCDPDTKFETDNKEVYYYPDLNTYSKNAISKLSKPRIGYIYSATRLGVGGFAQLINSNDDITGDNYEDLIKASTTLKSKSYDFNLNNTYTLEIKTFDEKLDGYAVADYELSLCYSIVKNEEFSVLATNQNVEGETEGEIPEGETEETTSDNNYEIIIKNYNDPLDMMDVTNPLDKNKPYKVDAYKNEDVLKPLKEVKIPEGSEIQDIHFELKVLPVAGSKSSILLKDFLITSTDDTLLAKNDTISFNDANEFLLRTTQAKNYWTYNDTRLLYKGTASVCDFVYDTYEAVFGAKESSVSSSVIETYVKNGWLKPEILDNFEELWAKGKKADALFQTFVLDKEKLPILNLIEVSRKPFGDVYGYTFKANVSGYKLFGYSKMPIFLAGTDDKGYDLLRDVFIGLRNSLGLGLLTFAICFSFGLLFGAVCGYFGGSIDIILQRFVDILSGVPWIVIMTLCILHFGSNFWTFILAMCMTGWIGTSSLTRTQFYRFRDREYTLASRTLGASNPRLIFRHILPNAMGTIITSSVLMIPSVIFSEATISYLGLGFQDMTSLGVILSEKQTYLLTYPHLILFPSIIMALIMISFNLFGNGLRDAFNPSLKGSE